MNIISMDEEPTCSITYESARSGGGSEQRFLHIQRAYVSSCFSDGLHGILVTSDLQGVTEFIDDTNDEPCVSRELLGVTLAKKLSERTVRSMFPHPEHLGVVLAGDLYSAPYANKMGASGDVSPVWEAFAERFRWVVGVAGNHDMFGQSAKDEKRFHRRLGTTLLHGTTVEADGLRIGGVGGIIGDPRKPRRVDEHDFAQLTRNVLSAHPDMIVFHQGPDGVDKKQIGHCTVRDTLNCHATNCPLVVCGHAHWLNPYSVLASGVHVLNVDARAILLLPNTERSL